MESFFSTIVKSRLGKNSFCEKLKISNELNKCLNDSMRFFSTEISFPIECRRFSHVVHRTPNVHWVFFPSFFHLKLMLHIESLEHTNLCSWRNWTDEYRDLWWWTLLNARASTCCRQRGIERDKESRKDSADCGDSASNELSWIWNFKQTKWKRNDSKPGF